MDLNNLKEFWNIAGERLQGGAETMAQLPPYVAPLLAVTAMALAFIPQAWKITGLINTVVHETGHALAALTVFSRLRGIRINLNHSGDTQYLSSGFLPFRIWATWWGYSFPGVAGWALVAASLNGWSGVALSACALIAIIVTLQIRNLIAFLTIGLTSAVILLAWWFLPGEIAAALIFFAGWFFALSGVKAAVEIFQIHTRGNGQDSDASALRNMTLIPAYVWCATFIGVNAFCLYKVASDSVSALA